MEWFFGSVAAMGSGLNSAIELAAQWTTAV